MYNWDTTKNVLDFGDLDLIFKLTAVEKLKIHDGGHLFSLKTLLLVFLFWCYCYDLISNCRAAAMTLRTVLLSLQALLAAAEPDDPQDAVVAKQYKENPKIFFQTARHWTNIYAGGTLTFFQF